MGQPTSTGEVRQFTLDTEKKYGLPEGMLYKQAGIESNYGKLMLSPKGAKGWFGFMDATAKEYGLDDPNDFHKSADAAGRKMRDLMKQHGGNENYALVDYNGGWRAVDALRAGKPWKESAGYLSKYHGKTLEDIQGGTYTPPALGKQFTTQEPLPLTEGPNASALAIGQQRHDNEYGGFVNSVKHLPAAIGLGFETQNTVYNFMKDKGVNSSTGDLLDWNSPEAKETLSKFPENHWGYLLQATTQDGLNKREARLTETMEKEQQLGQMGLGPALIGGHRWGSCGPSNGPRVPPWRGWCKLPHEGVTVLKRPPHGSRWGRHERGL